MDEDSLNAEEVDTASNSEMAALNLLLQQFNESEHEERLTCSYFSFKLLVKAGHLKT